MKSGFYTSLLYHVTRKFDNFNPYAIVSINKWTTVKELKPLETEEKIIVKVRTGCTSRITGFLLKCQFTQAFYMHYYSEKQHYNIYLATLVSLYLPLRIILYLSE